MGNGKKPVRLQGCIKTWFDDRGFGFIDAGGGHEVFVHIKDFSHLIGRPESGQKVEFELALSGRNRRRAVKVELISGRSEAQREKAADYRRPSFIRVVLFLLVVGGFVLGLARGFFPVVILLLYATASGVSLIFYGFDKAVAGTRARRVPEATLHLLDLLGGWPGGMLAQALFRHKIRKETFQAIFWTTVALNIGLVGGLIVFGSPPR